MKHLLQIENFLTKEDNNLYLTPIKLNLNKMRSRLSELIKTDGKPYIPSVFEKTIIDELES